MNNLKLKETMEQIHINKEMQKDIILNVKKRTKRRQRRKQVLKKTAAAVAVFALIAGAAIPIQAGIRYLVKDRMEQIPKQELEKTEQMLQNQDSVLANSFSRDYTREERNRLQMLEAEYKNGRFPDQTIAQTRSCELRTEDSLSYDADSGTFYLPERTLTDEELLQIIDFKYTTDYALAQGTAAKEGKRAQKKKEKSLDAALSNEGGITEQEALKVAETYLRTEFNLSAKDMDTEIFLDDQIGHVLAYHVSYQTQDDTYLYLFGIDISAKDGSLLHTSHASAPKDPAMLKMQDP